MTLQQLKYIVAVAKTGTFSEAAKTLFLSQPSLTKAIKELEKEMGVTIFDRTNKGVSVSKEGEIFLGYARQVLEQAALLEEKYKTHSGGKQEFRVSTQHYSFAVNAFVDLIKECGADEYDFSLRETQTFAIIDDVSKMKSEIGILYYNEFNQTVIQKLLKTNDLVFTELFTAQPHIFVSLEILLPNANLSAWKIWLHIHIFRMNRPSIIPFISPRKSSALLYVQKIFVLWTEQPFLTY